MTVKFDFALYTGEWRLKRSSSDGAEMVGTANIIPEPNRYSYLESGFLLLPTGQRLPFSRQYSFVNAGATLQVFFDAMLTERFLDMAIIAVDSELIGNGSHFCGSDTYVSEFRFLSKDVFQTKHVISGPRKDYTLETRYERCEAAPVPGAS